MTATLHVYTKNALLAVAQFGLNAEQQTIVESSNTPPSPDAQSKFFVVCCSSNSSVFDASFDKPLKGSATINGVTTQTGLLDNGPVALQYPANLDQSFFYDALYLTNTQYNPLSALPYTYTYKAWTVNDSPTVSRAKAKDGTRVNTTVLYAGVRSVLFCANLGTATFNTQTLFSQSYALCMIDLGQTYGTANGSQLGLQLQWISDTIMRLQKTGP